MRSLSQPSERSFVVQVLYDFGALLVSLRGTIALLALSMVLVFAGTLEQMNLGVWAVQEKYFRSFMIFGKLGPLVVPLFPGGYLVGGLLLLNLAVAFVCRFSFVWRKAGLLLAHFGLILLLLGELLGGLWQEDYHLKLDQGDTRNYAESARVNELVFIDASEPSFDGVVAIPESFLAGKQAVQHPKLPFRIVPRVYFVNSILQQRDQATTPSLATAGIGTDLLAAPQPVTHRPKERNRPAAYIEVVAPDRTLGVFLISSQLTTYQEFRYMRRTWRLALRPRRIYQPFSLTLLQFNHDRYPGTQIPKNFSSRLRLVSAESGAVREVLISMNNPLRYGGLTFYQSGFENNDRTTVLHVVRNPSWPMPYVGCSLMSLGLLVEFGQLLFGFIGERRAASVATSAVT